MKLLRFIHAFFLLFLALNAQAQNVNANDLPEALKNIKPVGSCSRDPAAHAPAAPLRPVPVVTPDFSCAIAADELQTLLTRSDTVLVDLRLPTEHQAFHIKDAPHFNVAELHAKPYWRNKTVVLIGNGKAELQHYGECTRLKQSGYAQVRVLRGGMPTWLAQEQPVIGRAPSAASLTRLNASEFWLESQNAHNLVLLSAEQMALKSEIKNAVVLTQTRAETLQGAVAQHRKAHKNAAPSAVILAAPSNISDAQIAQLQRALLPHPLLVYADTREAFVRQHKQQKAIWLAQAKGPKQLPCGL